MKKGFTLIETIVVIMICAILAAITVPNIVRAKHLVERHSKNCESPAGCEPMMETRASQSLVIKVENIEGNSAWVGRVNIQGTDCIYLLGYNKGGISCNWNSSTNNGLGIIQGGN